MEHDPSHDPSCGTTRRSVLTKGVVGAAAVWASPVLTTVPAAAQQGSNQQPQPGPLDLVDIITGPIGGLSLDTPLGLAIDSNDRIFVADSGRGRIAVFTAAGSFSHEFGNAPGPGLLDAPVGLALDGDGLVHVVDNGDRMLRRYLSPGVFLGEVDVSGANGLTNNSALAVTFGAVAGSRDLAVADYSGDQVQVYSSTGAYVRTIGAGAFNAPFDVAVTSTGVLVISDAGNDRVTFYEADGTYLGEFDGAGSPAGALDQPSGLAIDASGRIYVTERAAHRIQIFDSAGNYLTHFGGPGSDPGQFDAPSGIAIDSTGRIVVADRFNDRIQIFQGLP